MLKINTDFKALRREDGETPVRPAASSQAGPAPSAGPIDEAQLTARREAIVQANRAASESRVRDLDSAQAVSRNLREAIAGARQQAFLSHEALSPERVRSLLE